MTTAEALAGGLRDAGVTCMFGLPGGEILDFVEAARRAGIRFVLTRHEATAAFMADVTGQITRRPGVCVSTLGPGAVNMTLGVANAYLDRSPLIAITACHATAAAPYATHQKLDLNAVYAPFTKRSATVTGDDTAALVAEMVALSVAPRMGPVHLALPSDVARSEERRARGPMRTEVRDGPVDAPAAEVDRVAREIALAKRPVVILGLDLDPRTDVVPVRAFVDALGVPVFVTPKAKGILNETHPLFAGVCAGVAGDPTIVDFLGQADLLVGVGFEPVESDKLWHQTMKVVSIGPVSIAADEYRPFAEAVGGVPSTLARIVQGRPGPFQWTPGDVARLRSDLDAVLRPAAPPRGLSGYELTRRLRGLVPGETVLTTDVGSVKMIATQAWTATEPLTFFESNGLSSMSYGFPAAMAARLAWPDRPIVCTIGDGGFSMTLGELETCVRERLPFITVVYNDSSLSLIEVAQRRRGYPRYGVGYGEVDFAAAAAGFGVWGCRVSTLDALDRAVTHALTLDGPAVIDAVVDPSEYHRHTAPIDRGAR
jgi:acetolactate synthase I/II/III large subunit